MARVYIELRENLYHLAPGGLDRVAKPGPGFAHVFTDHDQDWNFGLADIQGPVKFAESLVRRDLRERRELNEGDRLWLYRVRGQGDRFQAVYGILSAERYEVLQRRYLAQPDGMALCDGVSVALGLLKQARPGKSRTVVVQVADAVIVAMGDGIHCHWLVRMALQDNNLEETLKRVQAEAAWRKITLHGIDLIRALAGPSVKMLPPSVRQWPSKSYQHDGLQLISDLEAVLPRLSLEYDPITRQEALHRPLERAEPLAWLTLTVAGLALFLYGACLHGETATLRSQTALFRAQDAAHGLAAPKAHPAWQELTQLSEQLGPALGRPLAGEALHRLSLGLNGLGRIEEIKINEQPDGLGVGIKGGLSSGLDAGPVFQNILLGLAAQGFIIRERQLEMNPQGAAITIDAVLPGPISFVSNANLAGGGG